MTEQSSGHPCEYIVLPPGSPPLTEAERNRWREIFDASDRREGRTPLGDAVAKVAGKRR